MPHTDKESPRRVTFGLNAPPEDRSQFRPHAERRVGFPPGFAREVIDLCTRLREETRLAAHQKSDLLGNPSDLY